jgi:tRNA threonylcarbamoyladenosine biosynthesis protein TsaB
MTVLALDTSSRRRALGVLLTRDGDLLDHRTLAGGHLDRELPPALAALLRDDLEALACVLGPGSYTGLRVGIAAALGVAHARDLPLHGVGALDAVALAAPGDSARVEAVADAGRGALYVAGYARDGAGLRRVAEPRRVEAGDWSAPDGAVAVSFDPVPGALDVSADAARALAAAAAQALVLAPLSRAGLEPIYLHGGGSQPRQRRV